MRKIKERFPQLIDKFGEIDLAGNNRVTWEELKVFHGGAAEWLDYQLKQIIGLNPLKEQIRNFHRSVVLDQRRREAGHNVKTESKYHMVRNKSFYQVSSHVFATDLPRQPRYRQNNNGANSG